MDSAEQESNTKAPCTLNSPSVTQLNKAAHLLGVNELNKFDYKSLNSIRKLAKTLGCNEFDLMQTFSQPTQTASEQEVDENTTKIRSASLSTLQSLNGLADKKEQSNKDTKKKKNKKEANSKVKSSLSSELATVSSSSFILSKSKVKEASNENKSDEKPFKRLIQSNKNKLKSRSKQAIELPESSQAIESNVNSKIDSNRELEQTNSFPQPIKRQVVLEKDENYGFGFIAGSEKPLVIRFVTPDGPGKNKLLHGDQILFINDEDVEFASREHAIELIRKSQDTLKLVVKQPTPKSNTSLLLTEDKKALKKNIQQTRNKVRFKLDVKESTVNVDEQEESVEQSDVLFLSQALFSPNCAVESMQSRVKGKSPMLSNNSDRSRFEKQAKLMSEKKRIFIQMLTLPLVSEIASGISAFKIDENSVPIFRVHLEFTPNSHHATNSIKSFKYDTNTCVKDVINCLKEKLQIRFSEHFGLVLRPVSLDCQNVYENQDKSVKGCCLANEFILLDEMCPLYKISEVYNLDSNQTYECLFRFLFIPANYDNLIEHDLNSFNYLYEQSRNDVLNDRFGTELKYEIALHLATLSILNDHFQTNEALEKVIASLHFSESTESSSTETSSESEIENPSPISPSSASLASSQSETKSRLIDCEFRLEKHLSKSIFQSNVVKRKDLCKLLAKNLEWFIENKSLMNKVQLKLEYLRCMSELLQYSGRIFLANLTEQMKDVFIILGSSYGIATIVDFKNKTLLNLAKFESIENIRVSRKSNESSLVQIDLDLFDSTLDEEIVSKTLTFNFIQDDYLQFLFILQAHLRLSVYPLKHRLCPIQEIKSAHVDALNVSVFLVKYPTAYSSVRSNQQEDERQERKERKMSSLTSSTTTSASHFSESKNKFLPINDDSSEKSSLIPNSSSSSSTTSTTEPESSIDQHHQLEEPKEELDSSSQNILYSPSVSSVNVRKLHSSAPFAMLVKLNSKNSVEPAIKSNQFPKASSGQSLIVELHDELIKKVKQRELQQQQKQEQAFIVNNHVSERLRKSEENEEELEEDKEKTLVNSSKIETNISRINFINDDHPNEVQNQEDDEEEDHVIDYEALNDFKTRIILKPNRLEQTGTSTILNSESLPLIESFQFNSHNEALQLIENFIDDEMEFEEDWHHLRIEQEEIHLDEDELDSISSIEGSLKGISILSSSVSQRVHSQNEPVKTNAGCINSSTPLIHLYPKLDESLKENNRGKQEESKSQNQEGSICLELKQNEQDISCLNVIRFKHLVTNHKEEIKEEFELKQENETKSEMMMNIDLAPSITVKAHTITESQVNNDLFKSEALNQNDKEHDMDLENETSSSTIFLINNSPLTINQADLFELNQENQTFNQNNQPSELDVIDLTQICDLNENLIDAIALPPPIQFADGYNLNNDHQLIKENDFEIESGIESDSSGDQAPKRQAAQSSVSNATTIVRSSSNGADFLNQVLKLDNADNLQHEQQQEGVQMSNKLKSLNEEFLAKSNTHLENKANSNKAAQHQQQQYSSKLFINLESCSTQAQASSSSTSTTTNSYRSKDIFSKITKSGEEKAHSSSLSSPTSSSSSSSSSLLPHLLLFKSNSLNSTHESRNEMDILSDPNNYKEYSVSNAIANNNYNNTTTADNNNDSNTNDNNCNKHNTLTNDTNKTENASSTSSNKLETQREIIYESKVKHLISSYLTSNTLSDQNESTTTAKAKYTRESRQRKLTLNEYETKLLSAASSANKITVRRTNSFNSNKGEAEEEEEEEDRIDQNEKKNSIHINKEQREEIKSNKQQQEMMTDSGLITSFNSQTTNSTSTISNSSSAHSSPSSNINKPNVKQIAKTYESSAFILPNYTKPKLFATATAIACNDLSTLNINVKEKKNSIIKIINNNSSSNNLKTINTMTIPSISSTSSSINTNNCATNSVITRSSSTSASHGNSTSHQYNITSSSNSNKNSLDSNTPASSNLTRTNSHSPSNIIRTSCTPSALAPTTPPTFATTTTANLNAINKKIDQDDDDTLINKATSTAKETAAPTVTSSSPSQPKRSHSTQPYVNRYSRHSSDANLFFTEHKLFDKSELLECVLNRSPNTSSKVQRASASTDLPTTTSTSLLDDILSSFPNLKMGNDMKNTDLVIKTSVNKQENGFIIGRLQNQTDSNTTPSTKSVTTSANTNNAHIIRQAQNTNTNKTNQSNNTSSTFESANQVKKSVVKVNLPNKANLIKNAEKISSGILSSSLTFDSSSPIATQQVTNGNLNRSFDEPKLNGKMTEASIEDTQVNTGKKTSGFSKVLNRLVESSGLGHHVGLRAKSTHSFVTPSSTATSTRRGNNNKYKGNEDESIEHYELINGFEQRAPNESKESVVASKQHKKSYSSSFKTNLFNRGFTSIASADSTSQNGTANKKTSDYENLDDFDLFDYAKNGKTKQRKVTKLNNLLNQQTNSTKRSQSTYAIHHSLPSRNFKVVDDIKSLFDRITHKKSSSSSTAATAVTNGDTHNLSSLSSALYLPQSAEDSNAPAKLEQRNNYRLNSLSQANQSQQFNDQLLLRKNDKNTILTSGNDGSSVGIGGSVKMRPASISVSNYNNVTNLFAHLNNEHAAPTESKHASIGPSSGSDMKTRINQINGTINDMNQVTYSGVVKLKSSQSFHYSDTDLFKQKEIKSDEVVNETNEENNNKSIKLSTFKVANQPSPQMQKSSASPSVKIRAVSSESRRPVSFILPSAYQQQQQTGSYQRQYLAGMNRSFDQNNSSLTNGVSNLNQIKSLSSLNLDSPRKGALKKIGSSANRDRSLNSFSSSMSQQSTNRSPLKVRWNDMIEISNVEFVEETTADSPLTQSRDISDVYLRMKRANYAKKRDVQVSRNDEQAEEESSDEEDDDEDINDIFGSDEEEEEDEVESDEANDADQDNEEDEDDKQQNKKRFDKNAAYLSHPQPKPTVCTKLEAKREQFDLKPLHSTGKAFEREMSQRIQKLKLIKSKCDELNEQSEKFYDQILDDIDCVLFELHSTIEHVRLSSMLTTKEQDKDGMSTSQENSRKEESKSDEKCSTSDELLKMLTTKTIEEKIGEIASICREFVNNSKGMISSSLINENQVKMHIRNAINSLCSLAIVCFETSYAYLHKNEKLDEIRQLLIQFLNLINTFRTTLNIIYLAASKQLNEANMNILMKQATSLANEISLLIKHFKLLL